MGFIIVRILNSDLYSRFVFRHQKLKLVNAVNKYHAHYKDCADASNDGLVLLLIIWEHELKGSTINVKHKSFLCKFVTF